MKAWRIAAGISCCLVLASGCGMCQHPYYYCGPVWSARRLSELQPRLSGRVGSQSPATGVATAEDVPETARRVTEPPLRATMPAPGARLRVAGRRPDGSESQVRRAEVDQQRRTPKRPPAERQTAQAPRKSADVPTAPSPSDLRPRSARVPAGTKEGDTRILSVTDRRSDEPRKNPKPVAARRKSPQRTAEGPSEDFDGWRPVAAHQDPAETATGSRRPTAEAAEVSNSEPIGGYVRHPKTSWELAVHDHQDALEAYSRGLEYLDYNEPDQAIRAFTEALKLNPRHVYAYFARGCAWAERGDLEQAIADYNEAIRLDPNYAAAYSNRAAVLNRRGDAEAAAADLERCRSLKGVV